MDKIKIMIDAGHYGKYNRSPAYPEYWESIMMWDLHLLLIEELKKYGFIVSTTRNNQDMDMNVYARGTKAIGYDLFLSLHSNAVGGERNDKIDYAIVYHLNNDESGKALADSLSDVIAKEMNLKQGGRTGVRLQSNGVEYYGILRGAKAVGCPHAYIVEHSFHTAYEPSKWLMDRNNLKRLARIEAEKIADFYNIKKEDEEMTKEEVQQMIDEAIEKSKPRVWHYWSEIEKEAHWAYKPLMALHDKKIFQGASPSDLQLDQIKLECLVIVARSLKELGVIDY